jgi:glucose-1-phosphate thymidylyltransferase
VKAVEKRTGLKIFCLEEIALIMKWISKNQIHNQTIYLGKFEYAKYLLRL